MSSSVGLLHFWYSGDHITHLVAVLLLIMSVGTWYFILRKCWFLLKYKQITHIPQQFWQAASPEQGIAILKAQDTIGVYRPLAENSLSVLQQFNQHGTATLVQHTSLEVQTTQIIRQQLQKISRQLVSGQTILGSVSATAPFIGLFGTVWGIYHALMALSFAHSIQLSQITGSVGEALVMTGLGLAVAIPAALAFNAFNRTNHLILEELEGFAYDMHGYLMTLQHRSA